MNRNGQLIHELEREISTIEACLREVRDQLQGLPVGDPAHTGVRTIVLRLMDELTAACKTLTALERGVVMRPVRH